MFSWLVKKEKNARIAMCTKEVKWEIEALDRQERAEILALAQYLRFEILQSAGIEQTVLDNPLGYTRESLTRHFETMERIRDLARKELRVSRRVMRRSGDTLPDFSVKHIQNILSALELWMCTVGAGIVPDKKHEVDYIWCVMAGSQDCLEQAISSMRKVESQASSLSGVPHDGMFGRISNDEWLRLCNFMPSAFRRHAGH